MAEWTEFIKATVRPFIVVWGCVVYGICIMMDKEVPALLAGLIASVVIEYFGERVIFRIKEKTGSVNGSSDENIK
jgi:hypothetical protein